MNWKPCSLMPTCPMPVAYLPDATDFTDIPKLSSPGRLGLIYECPKCHGHGKWNLRLHAYGPGEHFQRSCGQCNGWGYVREADRSCLHEYRELSQPECQQKGIAHYGMCWHVVECVHCGRQRSYDSGD